MYWNAARYWLAQTDLPKAQVKPPEELFGSDTSRCVALINGPASGFIASQHFVWLYFQTNTQVFLITFRALVLLCEPSGNLGIFVF